MTKIQPPPPLAETRWHGLAILLFVASGAFALVHDILDIVHHSAPDRLDGEPSVLAIVGISALLRGLLRGVKHWDQLPANARLVHTADLVLGVSATLRYVIAPILLTGIGGEQVWIYNLGFAAAAWLYAFALWRGGEIY